MLQELESLLQFSPTLIAVFSGLSMLTVQMLKKSIRWVEDNALVCNWVLSLFFAGLVVYEVYPALEISVIAFLIMTSASGIYGSSKNSLSIELPNYSDEVK